MHEIFTGGEIPYGVKCCNAEVVEMVLYRGMRLRQPEHCPPDVYNVMFSCWKEVGNLGEFKLKLSSIGFEGCPTVALLHHRATGVSKLVTNQNLRALFYWEV